MTRDQAIQVCESQRQELQLDADMAVEDAEKAIVRYKEDPETPGPAEDRIAWIVTFACSWGKVIVHIDDRSQDVLAVKRTA